MLCPSLILMNLMNGRDGTYPEWIDQSFLTVLNSTIEGITGEGGATADITYDAAGNILDSITIFNSNTGGDTVDIQSTVANSVYNIATQNGNDTVNITSDSTTPPFASKKRRGELL